MAKRGRPTKYNLQLGKKICSKIANGKSLRRICKEEEMPSIETVRRWLIDEDKPEFHAQYARAREEQADHYADAMDDIAHDSTIDTQRARLIIDTRKWVSSKLKPKKYGDKLDVTTGNEKINRGMSDAELDAILKRVADKAS